MSKRTNMTSIAAVLAAALVWPGMAYGGLSWYDSQIDFEEAMSIQGAALDGVESFEENTLPSSIAAPLNDPLQSYVPSSYFPKGLTAMNLTVQSNMLGGNPTTPAPRGEYGLLVATEGMGIGNVTDIVMTNAFADSTDLIFGGLNRTGIGFDAITYMADSVEVRVYDTNDVFLGMYTSPADIIGSHFVGVSADVPIGRINIYDNGIDTGIQSGDNIQMWSIPEPATLSLLLLGSLSVIRRRR